MDTSKYFDVEPVYISLDKQVWVHPEIDDIVQWVKPEWDEDPDSSVLESSKPVYRVYLENEKKKKTAFIVFTSEFVDKKEPRQISEQLLNCTFDFTEEEGEDFVTSLAVTLHEDVWSPGGNQFLNSKMYRKIQRDLGVHWRVSFISPDVVLCKDGKEVWFES